MQKTFHIYKSSAGSGKTYTLVKEYLKIVLLHPSRVRNILAITFTNAAAAEMKGRILEELALLHDLEKHPGNAKGQRFLEELHAELVQQHGPEGVPSPQRLVEHAGQVLKFILHNYSDFAVSTIDSFVHRIIRTFAFDLHLPLNFEVELDANALLEQAVDLLISRAGRDAQLTRMLIAFIERQADDERDLRIEGQIVRLARTLMDEEGVLAVEQLRELSLDDFFDMIGQLHREMASFEAQVSGLAKQAMALIESQQLPAAAFYQSSRGIYNYFLQLSNGQVSEKIIPNNYVTTTIEQDKWCAGKATKDQQQDIEAIKGQLRDIYQQIAQVRESRQEDYFVCQAVNQNIFPLAVLNETARVLQEVKDENILLHISDFNKKIADIVAAQPVPFIYERIGERFQHYMIDEFQDTSSLQWQNLLPLVENSLASGHSSLVVGDGKQAIYRWRSGDVEQFASLPQVPPTIRAAFRPQWEASLVRHHQVRNLGTNWRSRQQIVEFNNAFFENARGLLGQDMANIYGEIAQKSLDSKPGGYVEICFVDDKDDNDNNVQEQQTLDRIVDTIGRLTRAGHPLSDITILCRANREGSLVACHLLENNISVISSDSLLLNQSQEVSFMCSLLKLAVNQSDKVAATEVLGYLVHHRRLEAQGHLHEVLQQAGLFAPNGSSRQPLPAQALEKIMHENGIQWTFSAILSQNIYDACESILRVFFPQASPPDPFLAFFMDVVFEYSEKQNLSVADFLEWWDKEGHKHSLELPQGIDAVQVMTIHRSKGLQFPVVIYPFAQPGRSRQTKDGQWADLALQALPQLPATWVTLSDKGTQHTPFAPLLEQEKQKTFLDLMNLLYVAFTRPQEKLFVISCRIPCDTKTGNPKPQPLSVNGLLHRFLEGRQLYDKENDLYCFGTFGPAAQAKQAEKAVDTPFTRYLSSPWHRAIRLKSSQSERGLQPLDQDEHLQKGNLLHRVMENMHTLGDLGPLLRALVANGELDEPTRQAWEQQLTTLLADPLLEGCFSPQYPARAEALIAGADGNFYRPDRVVFMPGKTIVIDYKTGKEYPSHAAQMLTYANLLTAMGYPRVQALLMYLDQGYVKTV